MKFIKDLILFLKNVANDPKIPTSDRTVILILLGLVISPIDLIPDWIPLLGLLDDTLILAVVLDYFFNHLDSDILLSHYPWDMKSFLRIKRTASLLTFFVPSWIKNKIWNYKPSPF